MTRHPVLPWCCRHKLTLMWIAITSTTAAVTGIGQAVGAW